ncbi:MAG: radical SAM protein [Deltaproteobacteria bacterium]|nr:radical SAM protein [Deltaproteobacteria bacterium]
MKKKEQPGKDLVRFFGENFVYDCISGRSFMAGEYIREAFRRQLKLQEKPVQISDFEKLNEAEQIIAAKKQEGLFLNSPLSGYEIPNLQEIVQSTCKELTFLVTERCNLRCLYCPYSAKVPQSGYRSHNETEMCLEIANQALNYFFNDMPSNAVIGFYGGETLLNFKLIKYIVEKIKKTRTDWEGLFTVSTNLTVYTPEIGDFLAENGFLLLVSFDGPQFIHDRNRRTMDNKGSYNTVFKNLKDIKKRHPDYFKTHVASNTVLTSALELDEVDTFFSDLSLEFIISRFSRVLNNVEFHTNTGSSESNIKRSINDWALNKLKTCTDITEIRCSPLLLNYCQNTFKNYSSPHPCAKDGLRPFKACIPGDKILVNTDGTLSICEKCESLKIGTLSTGPDKEIIQKIIADWQSVLGDDCLNCWASAFCSTCYIHAWDGNRFSRKKMREHCDEFLRGVERSFPVYLELNQRIPNFSNLFDDVDEKLIG